MKGTIYFKNKDNVYIFTCVTGKIKHIDSSGLNSFKYNTYKNRIKGKFSLDNAGISYLLYKFLL